MDERKLSSSMQSAELTQFQMLKIKKIEDKITSEAEKLKKIDGFCKNLDFHKKVPFLNWAWSRDLSRNEAN